MKPVARKTLATDIDQLTMRQIVRHRHAGSPGNVARTKTPLLISRMRPDSANRCRIRRAASVGTLSHTWSVSTLNVTEGFSAIVVTIDRTTAARSVMFLRSFVSMASPASVNGSFVSG